MSNYRKSFLTLLFSTTVKHKNFHFSKTTSVTTQMSAPLPNLSPLIKEAILKEHLLKKEEINSPSNVEN